MYCPNCGQKNLYNSRFCSNCGFFLKETLHLDLSELEEKKFKAKYLRIR